MSTAWRSTAEHSGLGRAEYIDFESYTEHPPKLYVATLEYTLEHELISNSVKYLKSYLYMSATTVFFKNY